jgi:HEAT repeat protein
MTRWSLILGGMIALAPSAGAAEPQGANPVGLPPEVQQDLVRLLDPEVIFIGQPLHDRLIKLPPEQQEAAQARLTTALASGHLEVRRRAALALHALGDDSGVPILIRDMATPDRRDRGNVAVDLRVMGDRRAIPVLIQAAGDPSPYVRSIALEALGELRAMDAWEVILDHLDDKEIEGRGLECIRLLPAQSACSALGALGDRRVIPHLIRALDDRDVEAAACQALGKLTQEGFGYDVRRWKDWWRGRHP